MEIIEKNFDTTLDNIAPIPDKQNTLIDAIKAKQQLIETLMKQRRKMEEKIKLPEMPNDKRNKLKTEGRLFININKMICYRAETALANELLYFSKADDEKRMLIKQIIQTPVNIMPAYNNKTLTVTLHTLYTLR